MTGYERVSKILKHQPVDRIAIAEAFWDETHSTWEKQGKIDKETDLAEHFNFDVAVYWTFDYTIDLDFVPEFISETEDTITMKDGNGAILKRHKTHDTTPEHIDFTITEREDWEKVKHLIQPERRRIFFDFYKEKKQKCKEQNRFFCWGGSNVFEQMHPIMGHENMLVGMALDPEWIKEVADTYSTLTIELMKILFEQEGKPDGIWFYEDMGYKFSPFMSPEMYREIIMPYHKKTIDFAHSLGLPVIMHSCGFIEPLLPHMIEAGIDALQVIEVKAGMDLLRIHEKYGEQIALIGGIDVRVLYNNDKAEIDHELESKIPIAMKGFGYVLHSDHSIPNTVDYETYRYFMKKGLELGTYTD